MSYFIIIRGPLGIGKSSISKKLAKILNAVYISIDSVLEENKLDKVSEKEKCIPTKSFIKANEIALPKVEQNLKKGKTVIFDGNFYHKEQLNHLKEKLSNYKHFIFTLKAPLYICIERDKHRKKPYGKLATKAVYSLVSRFDYGILINTENKSVDQIAKKILSYLPKK